MNQSASSSPSKPPSSKPPTLKRTHSSMSNSSKRTSLLKTSDTFASLSGTDTMWNSSDWKRLEDWYLRKDRDHVEAAKAFYKFESVQQGKENWPFKKILWRAKCLDTSAKAHGGLVPSQRKRRSMESTPELSRTPTRTPNRTPVGTPSNHEVSARLRTPNRTPSRSFYAYSPV
ncbi:hypothetical protein BDF21DRAFT_413001 [Thamnidium elegans]|uniref:Uncharacterized protein n=1 Tax=Thamnidium elegans TaxID=101142 RepID=A0A8H7VQD9_9FUNG|nr:hypothetical protein INT48_003316 [Thamnidium elegans]KAI8088344.1 hypothetical protein BDF21DRAFT_413001 [Thamnidium elegans]